MQVGDLIRFIKTGHLATVIGREVGYQSEALSVEDRMKLFVHGDVLKDTPSSDGITYMRIGRLRLLAEKVS